MGEIFIWYLMVFLSYICWLGITNGDTAVITRKRSWSRKNINEGMKINGHHVPFHPIILYPVVILTDLVTVKQQHGFHLVGSSIRCLRENLIIEIGCMFSFYCSIWVNITHNAYRTCTWTPTIHLYNEVGLETLKAWRDRNAVFLQNN